MSKKVILSHLDCPDGAASIYAAHCQFGDTAEYYLINYQEPLPKISPGAEVYFIDMSRPGETYLELLKQGCDVYVLDHHETALIESIILLKRLGLNQVRWSCNVRQQFKELLERLDTNNLQIEEIEDWLDSSALEWLRFTYPKNDPALHVFIDLYCCGSYLAWRTFFDEEPPPLIQYIDDRDRWVWQLPNSREINAGQYELWYQSYVGINTLTLEQKLLKTKNPSLAIQYFTDLMAQPDSIERLYQLGKPSIDRRQAAIAEICQTVNTATIDEHVCPYVNTSQYRSDVSEFLLKRYNVPLAVTWQKYPDGTYGFSLRSNGSIRVNRIAKKFGGGGHKAAAGFTLKPFSMLKPGDQFMVPQVLSIEPHLKICSNSKILTLPKTGLELETPLQPDSLVAIVKNSI